MKKAVSLLLAILLMIPAVAFALPELYELEIPVGTEEMQLPHMFWFVPFLVDEEGNRIEAEWTAEDEGCLAGESKFRVWNVGEEKLTAKTADGEYTTTIVCPEVYAVAVIDGVLQPITEEIVMDTPDPIIIAYDLCINGFSTIGTKGDAVSYHSMRDEEIDQEQLPLLYNMRDDLSIVQLTPAKKGTFKIVFSANGRTVHTINITVKKSALITE